MHSRHVALCNSYYAIGKNLETDDFVLLESTEANTKF